MSQSEGKIFVSPQELDCEHLCTQYNSLGEYLLNKLKHDNAANTILTDFDSGRSWTGAQLYAKIRSVAMALVDQYHVRPGTTACIAYDNTDTTMILAVGLICAGAVVACLYPKDPYPELLYLARKVEPQLLFCHEKNRINWSQQLISDLGYQMDTISMDGGDWITEHNLQNLMSYERPNEVESFAPVPCRLTNLKQHVALITMSSGTTGQPKAVPVTHWNCLVDLHQSTFSRHQNIAYNEMSFACCASLDYVSGRLIVLGAMSTGYNAIILNGFEPESYARAIEQYRVGMAYVGAASFYNLITWPRLDEFDLSSVRVVFPMGAKVIYLKEMGEFLRKHPHIQQVRMGYGTSEIGGASMNSMSPEQYLRDTENCGRLRPGVSAKIVDPDTGRLLGVNQIGIVHVLGETIFPGYYDKQKARELKLNKTSQSDDDGDDWPFVADSSVFDQDQFYITGDLGYFNDKEELFIIGRQKEMMSCRAAKKVLPQELEEVLAQHPAVDKVCVLGIVNKRAKLMHCPRAFVVPKQEFCSEPELVERFASTRPKVTLNEELDQELSELTLKKTIKHTGPAESPLSKRLPVEVRRRLATDLMEFSNERVSWEKQLTGGIVILDEIPTSRATGKLNKNFLRSLTTDTVEIYGDQSE